MGSEWHEVLLEDLADEITVGFVGSMVSEYVDEGIPFFRSKNVSPYRLDWDDIRYISKEFHAKIKKSTLRPGDVVIVRTGKPGTATIIPDTIVEANCSDLVIVRPGAKLNRKFLAYYLNSAATHHINSHLVGAVQQHFNVGAARKLRIPLPPLPEQKAIAHILGSLDDKIELNRRMNATMEGMAQALFKSWFVDFDPVLDNILAKNMAKCPSPNLSQRERDKSSSPSGRSGDDGSIFDGIPEELADRAEVRRQALADGTANREAAKQFPAAFQFTEELGWIPEGWGVKSFDDAPLQILDGDRGKNYPKRTEFTQTGHCLFLNAGNVTQKGFNFSSTDFISFERDELLRKGKLQREDIVLTTRGTVGNFAYYDKDIPFNNLRINSGMVILRSRPEDHYSLFLFQFLKSEYFKVQVKALITGSAQPQLPIRDIKKILIISPDKKHILSAFTNLITTILKKATKQAVQSRTITKLRDTLLPKLISGELPIPDAEKLAKEAKV